MLEEKLDRLSTAIEGLTAALLGGAAKQVGGSAFTGQNSQAQTQAVTGTAQPPLTPTGKYADAAKLSVDEIRARLLPVMQKHGAPAIEGALKAINQSLLSEVPAEQYPALLKAVANSTGGEV